MSKKSLCYVGYGLSGCCLSFAAAAPLNDGTCGTFGDASDDVSCGASNNEPGGCEIVGVGPMDVPHYANDSSGAVYEAFSDTDVSVIDAEDD